MLALHSRRVIATTAATLFSKNSSFANFVCIRICTCMEFGDVFCFLLNFSTTGLFANTARLQREYSHFRFGPSFRESVAAWQTLIRIWRSWKIRLRNKMFFLLLSSKENVKSWIATDFESCHVTVTLSRETMLDLVEGRKRSNSLRIKCQGRPAQVLRIGLWITNFHFPHWLNLRLTLQDVEAIQLKTHAPATPLLLRPFI